MTPLAAAAHEQHVQVDWQGFLIVMGVLAVVILYSHWLGRDDHYRPTIGQLLEDVDHVECANPDCTETICACRHAHECTGCTTIGCEHLNRHGGLLCWDCRLDCPRCAAELAAERDSDWSAGR